MAKDTYRVIQWATGKVGRVAIRHFVDNPTYELVGVLVTNPKKVGKDAGEIARIGPVGVLATDDVEAIIKLDADCVHFAPLMPDVALMCRLLRSGKNIVTPLGPYYRTEFSAADVAQIEDACKDGGTSFHGAGIHPGYAGDILPLTLTRLMSRVDRVHIYETINHLNNPSHYIEFMGFGRTPEDVRAKPGRDPIAIQFFAQSMAMLVEGLGKKIEKLTDEINLAMATQDIPYANGVIKAGTVAGQHYEWSAWVDGAPLATFHCFWVMGHENIEPKWDCGESGYRIVIEGDPRTEVRLDGAEAAHGGRVYSGLPWTAMTCLNVIPAVCDAAPGFITQFDLGVVRPRGLVRRERKG